MMAPLCMESQAYCHTRALVFKVMIGVKRWRFQRFISLSLAVPKDLGFCTLLDAKQEEVQLGRGTLMSWRWRLKGASCSILGGDILGRSPLQDLRCH